MSCWSLTILSIVVKRDLSSFSSESKSNHTSVGVVIPLNQTIKLISMPGFFFSNPNEKSHIPFFNMLCLAYYPTKFNLELPFELGHTGLFPCLFFPFSFLFKILSLEMTLSLSILRKPGLSFISLFLNPYFHSCWFLF